MILRVISRDSAHISESDFRRAELCLQRFYEIFADMYGEFHAYACNIMKEAGILYYNVCTCMQVHINVHIGIQRATCYHNYN